MVASRYSPDCDPRREHSVISSALNAHGLPLSSSFSSTSIPYSSSKRKRPISPPSSVQRSSTSIDFLCQTSRPRSTTSPARVMQSRPKAANNSCRSEEVLASRSFLSDVSDGHTFRETRVEKHQSEQQHHSQRSHLPQYHLPSQFNHLDGSCPQLVDPTNEEVLQEDNEHPSLFSFASTFQSLLHSQAPVASTHSAFSELLSVSSSAFPPSTLPVPNLPDLVQSTTSSESASTASSFSSASTTEPSLGLDLLSALAEEDWDPQRQKHPMTQASGTGWTRKHRYAQQQKQKAWAGEILGSLGLIEPDENGKRGSAFASPALSSLPLPIHHKARSRCRLSDSPSLSSSGSSTSLSTTKAASTRPTPEASSEHLRTEIMTRRTALFFERLYQPLCEGIFSRAWFYERMGKKDHLKDPAFAALALSMSTLGYMGLKAMPPAEQQAPCFFNDLTAGSFTMPLAVPSSTGDSRKRWNTEEALKMVDDALDLQIPTNTRGPASTGRSATIEAVMTSFFLSLALYNLKGDGWKDASFFRFSEAVTLAKIMRLDRVGMEAWRQGDLSGKLGNRSEEQTRLVKAWMLLVKAERWWSKQEDCYSRQLQSPPESKTSKQGSESAEHARPHKRSSSVGGDVEAQEQRMKRSRFDVSIDRDSFNVLLESLSTLGLPNSVRNQFRNLGSCIDDVCSWPTCGKVTKDRAIELHESMRDTTSGDSVPVELAKHTLQCVLWRACDRHNLIHSDVEGLLHVGFPLHVASDTLDLLDDLNSSLSEQSSSLNGAIVHALRVIRDCMAEISQSKYSQLSFSGEPTPSSSPGSDDKNKTKATMKIRDVAQTILFDLESFLQAA